MEVEYPSIARRYFSTLIDGLFVILTFISSSYLFDGEHVVSVGLRVGLSLFLFFIYEPFFTAFFCTIGQRVTGIRVRKINGEDHINLAQAYVRIVVKIALGIITFFSIPLSRDKRGIHDMVVGSLVIYKKKAS